MSCTRYYESIFGCQESSIGMAEVLKEKDIECLSKIFKLT